VRRGQHHFGDAQPDEHHAGEFALANSATWPEPAATTATDTTHYGKAEARAWDRLHPRLTHRAAWLLIIAHTQLRLARRLTEDLRHPWEKATPSSQLTPARVRRGFRNLRPTLALPAAAPQPAKPGPGRPSGIPNRRPAPRHDVGKTVKRGRTLAALQQSGG
jgi:hypothetical protein